jgi:hypothetical protein
VFFLLRWRIAPAEALNGPDDLALPQAALQAPKGIKQYDFEAFCLAARNEDPGFVGSTIEVQLPWDTLWKHNDGSVSFSGGAATGGEYIRCYPAFIFEGIKRHPWPIVRCRVLKVQWPPRAERDPAWKAGDNFIVVVDHCRIVTNEVDFNPPIDKRGFTHWLNSVAAGELEGKGK